MEREYIHFVREIYSYCDKNRKEEALFPVFVNLWNENGEDFPKSKKDLSVMTSKIISKLINKNVLEEIPKSGRFHVPYGLYKILGYEENLVRQDDMAQKRTKLFK